MTLSPRADPSGLPGCLQDGAGLLRHWRLRRGLTQERLADAASLHVRTIRGMETRHIIRPRRSSLNLLADALVLSEAARNDFILAWTQPRPTITGSGAVFSDGDRSHDVDALAHAAMDLFERHVERVDLTIGADGSVQFEQVDTIFSARCALTSFTVFVEPQDPTVDLDRLDIECLMGCVPARTVVDYDQAVKAFVLDLGAALRPGESAIVRYRVDHEAARTARPTEPVARATAGFFRPPDWFSMSVQFNPTKVPSTAHQHYYPRPSDRPSIVGSLDVSPTASVDLFLDHPVLGGHGISWTW